MDINLTLIGQTIAMIVFVWFCMKFIWPPIVGALEERQAKIEEGLAAARLVATPSGLGSGSRGDGLPARERSRCRPAHMDRLADLGLQGHLLTTLEKPLIHIVDGPARAARKPRVLEAFETHCRGRARACDIPGIYAAAC